MAPRFPLTVAEVEGCALPSWYPLLRGHTIESRVVPLPAAFVQYLLADGVFVPAPPTHTLAPHDRHSDDDDEEEEEEEEAAVSAPAPRFPALEAEVAGAIAALGGAVFPKLDWSAPRDAVWIAFDRTLRCQTASDVFLLLKSSDHVAFDLEHAFDHCTDCSPPLPRDHHLVLRRWTSVPPGLEFRCFVREGEPVAVSQRDPTNFYTFLPGLRPLVQERVAPFLARVVAPALRRGPRPLSSFACDLFLDPARDHRPTLVDVAPFSPAATDPLLFSWEELAGEGPLPVPLVRVVFAPTAVRPSLASAAGLPFDLTTDCAADAEGIVDFVRTHM